MPGNDGPTMSDEKDLSGFSRDTNPGDIVLEPEEFIEEEVQVQAESASEGQNMLPE